MSAFVRSPAPSASRCYNCGGGDASRIAELAVKRGLTAYDAAYLSLAIEERAELATFDAALAAAARIEQIKVIGAAP